MAGESLTTDPDPGTVARRRLDSWKEIAAYLRRGLRTGQRWEREEGLPVHRHLHGTQATVYAFADEIDSWLAGPGVAKGADPLPQEFAPERSPKRAPETIQIDRPSRPLMIAILPLRNLTGDLEQERFGDGLTEELISEIGQCCPKRLRVIALTSVIRYKQSPKSIEQIGRELGADYILEGGIRRSGWRVRLTARLIAARDQAHIWADTYEVQLPPIFSLQQALARQVADALSSELKVKPSPDRRPALAISPAAYDAFVQGRSFFLPTEGEIRKKLEHLYIAIERDPKFAPSYAELALTYSFRFFRDYPPVVMLARTREFASKSLKLDPRSARTHAMLAVSYLFGARNWPRAQKSSWRAIKLNPSDPWARIIRAAYHLVVEEPENAMRELEQARQLGPQSPELGQWFVVLGYFARHYDWAIERGQEMLRMDPSQGVAHALLGDCYAQKGDFALALQHSEMATDQLCTGPFVATSRAAATYALAGDRDAGERLLQCLVAAGEKEYVRYIFLAMGSVALGNDERTLDWLEKAYEQCDPLLVFLKAAPTFDRLSHLPRFRKLLRRIGLPK